MNESGEVVRQVGAIFSGGSVSGMTDAELLERFIHRRDDSGAIAFEAIVVRHGPMVMRICRATLRNAHDAEDAFQAVFLVLARKAGSLWVRDSLAGWLANVASRTANRSRSRIARHAALPLASEPFEAASDQEPSDTRLALFEEVQRLPDRTRVPMLLCYFEGLTHDAAAATLRVPVGTIHSRLSRGRERLKARLIRRGLAPSGALFALESISSAAISPALRESTIKSAISFATSGVLPAGTVPASVVALVQGVLGTMLLTKLQIAGAVVLSASLLAAGAVVVAQGPGGGKAQEEASATKAATSQGETRKDSETIQRNDGLSPDVAPPRLPTAAGGAASPAFVEVDSMPSRSTTMSAGELLVRFRIASRALAQVSRRFKGNYASQGEFDQAQGEVDLIEAQAQAQRDNFNDLVELLQAQREIREQEVEVERAISKGKRAEFDRLTNLMKRGPNLVSTSEMAIATAEAHGSDAEVRVKQAGVREISLRIDQASRRLRNFESVLKTIRATMNKDHPDTTNIPAPPPSATDTTTGPRPAPPKP